MVVYTGELTPSEDFMKRCRVYIEEQDKLGIHKPSERFAREIGQPDYDAILQQEVQWLVTHALDTWRSHFRPQIPAAVIEAVRQNTRHYWTKVFCVFETAFEQTRQRQHPGDKPILGEYRDIDKEVDVERQKLLELVLDHPNLQREIYIGMGPIILNTRGAEEHSIPQYQSFYDSIIKKYNL